MNNNMNAASGSTIKHTVTTKTTSITRNTNHLDAVKKEDSRIEKNYNCYYSTGTYQSRYPSVNQQTLSIILTSLQHMSSQQVTRIFDYGCGEGRYLCHLLPAYPCAHFTAYDISSKPLETLANTLVNIEQISRVDIVYGEEALQQYLHAPLLGTASDTTNNLVGLDDTLLKIKSAEKFSLVLLLFGVLSHVPTAEQRHRLLNTLRDSLAPQNGRLILSVPNKARRFFSLQRKMQSHEITYSRTIKQQTIDFYYYLYDAESIQKEIQAAGLDIINVEAESVLPESWVTNYRLLGWIDRQACRWIPAKWGYGILVSCKVARTSR